MTLIIDYKALDWTDQALCKGLGPTKFFAPEQERQPYNPETYYDEARSYCERCPVIEDCVQFAIGHYIAHGLWGGASPRQRRLISRGLLQLCTKCHRWVWYDTYDDATRRCNQCAS